MEENRKQQLAISSSKPPASGEVAPSFAVSGNDNCVGDETKAITLDLFMKGPQSGEITHENPAILRLEELTSMDPTVEVGFEMAASVDILKLTNSSNPEVERAGEKASRGARLLQEGAKLVTESQQILRSTIFYDYKSSSTLAPKRKYDETTEATRLTRAARIPAGRPFPFCTEDPSADSEALVNYGVYTSVKSQLASGKGTKTQTSSTAQAASQTQSTNQNGAS